MLDSVRHCRFRGPKNECSNPTLNRHGRDFCTIAFRDYDIECGYSDDKTLLDFGEAD